VNNTICINPGRLSKGKTGGTYAKVTVFPVPRQKEKEKEKEGEDEEKQTDAGSDIVGHRTKVEIVRI
jgi:DNA polymerase alpha subunit B